MSRSILYAGGFYTRRILCMEEYVWENQKRNWEENMLRSFCPGGYFPGGKRSVDLFGGKYLWRKL